MTTAVNNNIYINIFMSALSLVSKSSALDWYKRRKIKFCLNQNLSAFSTVATQKNIEAFAIPCEK